MPLTPLFGRLESDIAEDAEIAEAASTVLSEYELRQRGPWRNQRACSGHPPHLWFPERRASFGHDSPVTAEDRALLNETAGGWDSTPQRVCMACPVRDECLSDCMHGDDYGIWGGRSRIFRRKVRAYLDEHDPLRLNPECGTAGGWLRHRRMSDLGSTPCEPCEEAAKAAGIFTRRDESSPLLHAILGFGAADELVAVPEELNPST